MRATFLGLAGLDGNLKPSGAIAISGFILYSPLNLSTPDIFNIFCFR